MRFKSIKLYAIALIPLQVVLLLFPISCSSAAERVKDSKKTTFIAGSKTKLYKIHGLNFSPFIDGQDPAASPVTVKYSQLYKRMKVIASQTRWIRTFSCGAGMEKAGKAARSLKLKIAMGAWIGRDKAANEAELERLIKQIKAGRVDMAMVGNEALLRGDITETELIEYIEKVKKAVSGTGRNIPVGTVEVYREFINRPALMAACDKIMANYYPYWEGVQVEKSIDRIKNMYKELQNKAGNKELIISETGWPSGGDSVGQADPSPSNAAYYFHNFTEWARENKVKFFYFEAFDEKWKASYEGPQGAHWGIRDHLGRLKPGMETVFTGRSQKCK